MDPLVIAEVAVVFIGIVSGLVLYILPLVGECVVQFVLSKKESKIWGMILPVFSLVRALGVTGFASIYVSEVDGSHNVGNTIGLVIMFLFMNVVTVVEMIIYYRCRKQLDIEDKDLEMEIREELKASNL